MMSFFTILSAISIVATCWAEGESIPEWELASPIGLPSANRPTERPAHCAESPCAAGCQQSVSCNDYNPKNDECPNPQQVLVGWECRSPCSCAADGSIVCTISYRCEDASAAIERAKEFHQRVEIDLSIPFSGNEEPQPAEGNTADSEDP